MSGYATGQSQDQVQAAIAAAMPAPSAAMPPATALDGRPGSAVEYSRADHTHAARVQRTAVLTVADGTATWTFARPIVCPTGKVPPIAYMVEDTGNVVAVQVFSRTFTNDPVAGTDTHIGVVVKAQRARALPALTGIALIGSLITALSSFNPFGDAAVSGVKVNLFAADPTQ